MTPVTPVTSAAAVSRRAPYPGIEPFRFPDREVFFARDRDTQALLRLVTVYRAVLVYGESGTGKSSLINAGFIPAALGEDFGPERLGVQPRPGEEIVVQRIRSAAGDDQTYLPSVFASADDTADRVVLSVGEFERALRELPRERVPVPVLIFDQFEELVTLFAEAARGEAHTETTAMQTAIQRALAGLIHDQTIPVKLVFAFREDYLAKLSPFFAAVPGLRDRYLRLTPPPVDALYGIIRGPFDRFPDRFGNELSPDLARKVAAQIAGRTTGGALNLSEVQIAALTLWQAPDPDALFGQVDGVQGLLETYLSDAIDRLAPALRDPAVALLSQLVTTGGTRNVVSVDDLLQRVEEEDDVPPDVARRALAALERDARLVRREMRHDSYFYEIVSEFLVPWISEQRVVRRQAAAHRRELLVAQAQAGRLRLRLTFALIAATLAILSACVAVYFFAQAGEERDHAEAQAATAAAVQATAEWQSNVSQARALVIEAPRQHGLGEDERGALLARQAYIFDQASGGSVRGPVDDALRTELGRDHFGRILRGHEGRVNAVAFSPDGTTLATGSSDGTVRLWAMTDPAAPAVLAGHEGSVNAVAFAPDGRTLATGSGDGTVRLWNPSTESLADLVCQQVWRNLTMEEWAQFVGENIPYEQTCPNRPPGGGAPGSVAPNASLAATPVGSENT